MKKVLGSLIVISVIVSGSLAIAQMGGGTMMGGEGRPYGPMSSYVWWWGLFGLVRAAVIVIGLWLLYRITRAVERIAELKS